MRRNQTLLLLLLLLLTFWQKRRRDRRNVFSKTQTVHAQDSIGQQEQLVFVARGLDGGGHEQPGLEMRGRGRLELHGFFRYHFALIAIKSGLGVVDPVVVVLLFLFHDAVAAVAGQRRRQRAAVVVVVV